MSIYLWFALLISSIALSAFFSAVENVFLSLSPLLLKKMQDDGDTHAKALLELLADKQKILFTALFGNSLSTAIFAISAHRIVFGIVMGIPLSPDSSFFHSRSWLAYLCSVLTVTILYYLIGQLLPKTLAVFKVVRMARLSARPLKLFMFFFGPVNYFVNFCFRNLCPAYSEWNEKLGSTTSLEELDSFFSLGEEAGIIEGDDKELLSSVFEFGDTLVREVMVPRPDIVGAPINIPLDDLFKLVREDGHSRLPVYDGSMDKVLGILYVKDLLIKLDEVNKSYDLFKLLRVPFFVPETKKLDDLLKEFQKKKIHLALVVDEYGGVSGLVTIEDLLEEIVGEIVDEYDIDEQSPLTRLSENSYLIVARYSIDELEESLGITLDYEDAETVGGFILEKLGRIPKKGESVHESNATFQVTEMKGNRILRVKVEVATAAEQSG